MLSDIEFQAFVSQSGEKLFAEFISDWSRRLQVALGVSIVGTLLLAYGIVVPAETSGLASKFTWSKPSTAPLVAGVVTLFVAVLYIVSCTQDLKAARYRRNVTALGIINMNRSLREEITESLAQYVAVVKEGLALRQNALDAGELEAVKRYDRLALEHHELKVKSRSRRLADPRRIEAHDEIAQSLERTLSSATAKSESSIVCALWDRLQCQVQHDRTVAFLSVRAGVLIELLEGNRRFLRIRTATEVVALVILAIVVGALGVVAWVGAA